MKPQFDIVVPDHYHCDFIFPNLEAYPALGSETYVKQFACVPGGPLNTVVALHRMGLKVGWNGKLGTDFFSHFVEHKLEEEGLDLSLVNFTNEPFQRMTVALSFPADRAFLTYIDKSASVMDMALEVYELAEFRHLHLTCLVVDPRLPAFIDRCHANGIVVSMDCQHHTITLEEPLVRDILSRADVFMPNCCEATRITGTQEPPEALEVLASFIPTVVIKCGAQGAIAAQGDERYRVKPLPVHVIDTTGAGDVFNAGFLAAFRYGENLETCLHWGNYCGGCSTEGIGGTLMAPHLAQVQSWWQSQQQTTESTA